MKIVLQPAGKIHVHGPIFGHVYLIALRNLRPTFICMMYDNGCDLASLVIGINSLFVG